MALWVRLLIADAPQDVWIWQPRHARVAGDVTHLRALRESSWTELEQAATADPAADPASLLLLLWGQMADVLGFVSVPENASHWLVRQEDLTRVQATPMMLAFSRPPQVQTFLQDHPDTGAVQIAADLPPPQFGEFGVAYADDGETDDSPSPAVYPLAVLGTEGDALQHQLRADLEALVAPADWWILTEVLKECRLGGSGQARQSALLAALDRAGTEQERASIQQSLDELGAAFAQADALLAAHRKIAEDAGTADGWQMRLAAVRMNAAELAGLYWEYHEQQREERLQHRREATGLTSPSLPATSQDNVPGAARQDDRNAGVAARPSRSLPRIPHVFAQQIALPFPEPSLPVEAVLAAYSNAQSGATSWGDAAAAPEFLYERPGGDVSGAGTAIIQLRPETEGLQTQDVIEALWKQVRKFSELDGDVFLCALIQWLAASPAQRDEAGRDVWITASQILDYRGIKPIMKREGSAEAAGRAGERRAGHRHEDLERVAQCFAHMRNTWVTLRRQVAEVKVTGKRKRRVSRIQTHASALIQIAEIVHQRDVVGMDAQQVARLSDSDEAVSHHPALPVAWRYRIGTWLDPFVIAPNRPVARLVGVMLRYDPIREYWEKRLARYLLFRLRLTSSGSEAALITPVGVLLQELSLPMDERHPEKTRTRLENALDRLCADRQIAAWAYEDDRPVLPARRWLPVWLADWRLRITVPPMVSLPEDTIIADEYPALPTRAATMEALRAELKATGDEQ